MPVNLIVAVYFACYVPIFFYNPTNSSTSESYRLCDTFDWERDDPRRNAAYEAFSKALILQFNHNFGTDVDNLFSWQLLASFIGIEPIPDTLHECRRQVKASHVNLVDLVDGFPFCRQARRFPSEVALSRDATSAVFRRICLLSMES